MFHGNMPLNIRHSLDKVFAVHIKLLDNSIININVPVDASGHDCVVKVAQLLGLQEVSNLIF